MATMFSAEPTIFPRTVNLTRFRRELLQPRYGLNVNSHWREAHAQLASIISTTLKRVGWYHIGCGLAPKKSCTLITVEFSRLRSTYLLTLKGVTTGISLG